MSSEHRGAAVAGRPRERGDLGDSRKKAPGLFPEASAVNSYPIVRKGVSQKPLLFNILQYNLQNPPYRFRRAPEELVADRKGRQIDPGP